MKARRDPDRQSVRRLFELRNRYDATAAAEKLELLTAVCDLRLRSAADLSRLHSALCFVRAFPDSREHYRIAGRQLRDFHRRVAALTRSERSALDDSGIAGTRLHYAYSFPVAQWLARRAPGSIAIDWQDFDDNGRLDELLELTLHDSEEEYFNSGRATAREWLEIARGSRPAFDWILAQLRQPSRAKTWAPAYDAADLPLTWTLGDLPFSRTRNAFATRDPAPRSAGMRRHVPAAAREIRRPFNAIERLSPGRGARMIDVAMASLAVRHRETYHFNHANPADVHVADAGCGITIAVFGLLPEYRFPVECTLGYLVLSNGMPVGYGGASTLFRQINTGVNIFDEYRGSEAAYLWVQVMRVFHQLTGCTRFIANPYQFGAGNDEALQSGAFWFYYRLGYRPVDPGVRAQARDEWLKLRSDTRHRTRLATLRRLAGSDLHFCLPGARRSELFDERWIETASMLATRELAGAGHDSRAGAARVLARKVSQLLGIRNVGRLRSAQRRGIELLAPFAAVADPSSWPRAERKALRELLLAKGAPGETAYARRLCEHRRFLQALRQRCRAAERKAL